VSDIETIQVTSGSFSVHEGFLEAIDSVWPEIAGRLDEVKCPLFYAGHSLGAALATLAATRRQPQALYTFGSPSVGNDGFVASLRNALVYRVVDDSDEVTTLSPEVLGFHHAGELHRLTASPSGGYSFNPLDWWRWFMSPPKPLADHAPINYVERIL